MNGGCRRGKLGHIGSLHSGFHTEFLARGGDLFRDLASLLKGGTGPLEGGDWTTGRGNTSFLPPCMKPWYSETCPCFGKKKSCL